MTDVVALLLRRAGFGPTATELSAARRAGYAATVSTLLAPAGPDVGATKAPLPRLRLDPYAGQRDPTPEQKLAFEARRARETEEITRWWVDRMVVANHQALEKLIFFWHGHWATSIKKVRSPQLMMVQHHAFRQAPDFVSLARQMVVDPALVLYLDGHRNTAQAPNENLARELLELFVLGIGQYTEADVKNAGRALTGWRYSLADERSLFDPLTYDSGSKTILGVTGNLGADGLIDLLLRQEACPRFVAARLWFRYASPTRPLPPALQAAMVEAFPVPTAMLRVMFTHEAFSATDAELVKQPIEWFVGAMRQLGLRPAALPAETRDELLKILEDLGQLPFAPPNVGGWRAGTAWLTSAAAQTRLRLAGKIAQCARVERLTPESLAYLLCVETWSNRTYAVLRDSATDQQRLLTLGLVSPEYLVT